MLIHNYSPTYVGITPKRNFLGIILAGVKQRPMILGEQKYICRRLVLQNQSKQAARLCTPVSSLALGEV